MKTLIMTVGLPKSGKSTWAKEQGIPIVNPDSIRLALHGHDYIQSAEPFVWAIAHTMVQALFCAGHDKVILDACNCTEKRRNEWILELENYQVEFVLFTADADLCIFRAEKENNNHMIPVIKRMSVNLKYPFPEKEWLQIE